jgi:hypothetical protein
MTNYTVTCINQHNDEIIVVAQGTQDTNMMPYSIFYSNSGQDFINFNVIVENNFQLNCPYAYVYNGVIYTNSYGIKENAANFLNDDTVFIYQINVQ